MSDTIRLAEIAHARSGDKGNHANIGIIAYTQAGYDFLGAYLTAERLNAVFFESNDIPAETERFSMPGIRAYNFLVRNVLQGGASQSLKTDNQGKVLALAVLEMRIPTPEHVDQMLRVQGSSSKR